MIAYDTKRWGDSLWKIFLSMHWGKNYRILLRSIFLVLVYSSLITYLNINYFDIHFHIDTFYFSLLGLILSLFLVFRMNTSYSKWWEGRQQWGNLVNRSRTLSAYLSSTLTKEDLESRTFYAVQISNFAYALKGHLRSDIQFENLDLMDESYINSLRKQRNVPHKLAELILATTQQLFSEGKLSDIDKLNIKNEVTGMLDILGACERIRNTPIPFSHSSFFKSFIVIYILALPFGFVNTFLYFTIPATLLIAYALLGVEIISEEIEEPFSKDPNDLPLTFLSGVIRKDVYAIFELTDILPQIVDPIHGSSHFKITH